MRKRLLLLLMGTLVLGSLLWLPLATTRAQESGEDENAEVVEAETEAEDDSPAGPGLIILLVGLGALGLVGLAHMARQSGTSGEEQPVA